ncbi:hypothetical protein [Streptomyces daliensis]|uniref:Uncharacterized protein n=1 Tax=Streptomyces daliensis TaxID=299421 RepID=A0A8T4J0D2_9ACTN|nr:hypothetical protein [Streptomyces daliensis]
MTTPLTAETGTTTAPASSLALSLFGPPARPATGGQQPDVYYSPSRQITIDASGNPCPTSAGTTDTTFNGNIRAGDYEIDAVCLWLGSPARPAAGRQQPDVYYSPSRQITIDASGNPYPTSVGATDTTTNGWLSQGDHEIASVCLW